VLRHLAFRVPHRDALPPPFCCSRHGVKNRHARVESTTCPELCGQATPLSRPGARAVPPLFQSRKDGRYIFVLYLVNIGCESAPLLIQDGADLCGLAHLRAANDTPLRDDTVKSAPLYKQDGADFRFCALSRASRRRRIRPPRPRRRKIRRRREPLSRPPRSVPPRGRRASPPRRRIPRASRA
jgi:hypothetical protein